MQRADTALEFDDYPVGVFFRNSVSASLKINGEKLDIQKIGCNHSIAKDGNQHQKHCFHIIPSLDDISELAEVLFRIRCCIAGINRDDVDGN